MFPNVSKILEKYLWESWRLRKIRDCKPVALLNMESLTGICQGFR